MDAKEFMTTGIVTCRTGQTLHEANLLMLENDYSEMLVVDDEDNLVGVLTESDYVGKNVQIPHALAPIKELFGQTYKNQDIEKIYISSKDKKLETIVNSCPVTITPDTSLTRIVEIMRDNKLDKLPVVEKSKLVGVVTRKSLLKAFKQLSLRQ